MRDTYPTLSRSTAGMAILGVSLVAFGYSSYLAMLFVLRRFTYRTWLFHAVILAGMALAVVGLGAGESALPAWIAIGLGLAWFPLTRRELTLLGSERLNLRTGARLPTFAALRSDGTPITDREVVAQAPALLALYRGWWCPSTRVQLDELLRDHEQMATAGLSTFAASVDPPEKATGLQEHVGDRITIICGFPVVVLDAIGARDRRGAPWYDRLLFRAPRGDIAMPASLVVDASGRIVCAFRARRVDDRPRPKGHPGPTRTSPLRRGVRCWHVPALRGRERALPEEKFAAVMIRDERPRSDARYCPRLRHDGAAEPANESEGRFEVRDRARRGDIGRRSEHPLESWLVGHRDPFARRVHRDVSTKVTTGTDGTHRSFGRSVVGQAHEAAAA